jgi:two-component system response regulator NreC
LTAKTSVLLVDDHSVVRKGVRALLEEEDDFEVVADVGNGQDALREVGRFKPDLVLLDITLPDMNGLEAMSQIKEISPATQVVVLTMHQDEDYFFRAIHAGAVGYVSKGAASEHILAALRAVQDGGVYLHPSLAKSLVTNYLLDQEGPQVGKLSPRELEVLRLIGEGLGNKEIASRLGLSVTTAQTHRTRIMEKVGLHTVAELIRYAIRKGIIRP